MSTTTERMEGRAAPMWDEVKRLMDAHGIEDVEELHRRFVASSVRGLIPVSGRHSDKPVKLPEFCEHITGRYPVVYREVVQGLFEIFEIDPQSTEAAKFVLSYMWGRPDGGVHPKTPLP